LELDKFGLVVSEEKI